jgi:hypothetical protein
LVGGVKVVISGITRATVCCAGGGGAAGGGGGAIIVVTSSAPINPDWVLRIM